MYITRNTSRPFSTSCHFIDLSMNDFQKFYTNFWAFECLILRVTWGSSIFLKVLSFDRVSYSISLVILLFSFQNGHWSLIFSMTHVTCFYSCIHLKSVFDTFGLLSRLKKFRDFLFVFPVES